MSFVIRSGYRMRPALEPMEIVSHCDEPGEQQIASIDIAQNIGEEHHRDAKPDGYKADNHALGGENKPQAEKDEIQADEITKKVPEYEQYQPQEDGNDAGEPGVSGYPNRASRYHQYSGKIAQDMRKEQHGEAGSGGHNA